MTAETAAMSNGVREQYERFTGRRVIFILSLLPVLLIISGITLSTGSADVSVWDAYTAILHRLLPDYINTTELAEICIWELRLPRILMGIIAGVGLGIAGGVLQGILKNPLASPYTLGVASSAGFGASLAIVAGVGFFGGQYLVIGNAFICALICSFVILGLASRKGGTSETMILAGIAMMYLFSAATTVLQYFGEAEAVKEAIFWTVGSLGRASWSKLLTVSIVLVVCLPLLLIKSRDLNVMGTGDETAESLGINVKQTRIVMMVISSLLTASIVCYTGTIGFIGLVAPHLVRMVIGGDNRFLLPASGLIGAVLLIVSDSVARMILAPIVLPVGAMTAFLGVPLFFYLIMRRRREYF